MDSLALILKFYPIDNELRQLLLIHSWQVCRKSLLVAVKHPELHLNKEILFHGSILHDVGIFLTNAPGIHCQGRADYLLHGYYGGLLLRKEGLPELARICERHTGAGLSKKDLMNQHIPLPLQDYLPESLEEQVVCYSDKFYSKSSPSRIKSYEQAYKSLLRFGSEGAERFKHWHECFM